MSKKKYKKKIICFCKRDIMQFFSADAPMFLFHLSFWPQKNKKITIKSGSEILTFFSPLAQTEESIFQNVDYRAIVYKTGPTHLCKDIFII